MTLPDMWGNATTQSVAVTGATGFIGRNVLDYLRSRGVRVIGITRLGAQLPDSSLVSCDYWNVARLTTVLRDSAVVVHAAGLAHAMTRGATPSEAELQRANVESAVCVARAAREAGLKRVVLVSSAGVMGPMSPPGGFRDDDAPCPYDAYTRSKYAAELGTRELATSGFGVVVLRPPMVYGRGAPGNFQRIVKWVLKGWPIPVGAASAKRSVIGVRNLREAVATAVLSPNCGDTVALVADHPAMHTIAYIQKIGEIIGRPARCVTIPSRLIAAGAMLVGRSRDAQRLLGSFEIADTPTEGVWGWRPRYSTEEELRFALAEYAR